jgi:hypothetical protein
MERARLEFVFPHMAVSLSQLLEDSFQIAWEYLERTGELGDAAAASRFLSDTIEIMIRAVSATGWPSPIEPSAPTNVIGRPTRRRPPQQRAHPPEAPLSHHRTGK